MKEYSFSAVIENGGGGGVFVRVPIDAEKEFGRKRVKIRATIDGEAYRGSLAWMGGSTASAYSQYKSKKEPFQATFYFMVDSVGFSWNQIIAELREWRQLGVALAEFQTI